MRLLVLLLSISVVDLVLCTKVSFPANILQPDLDAIEKYYNKFGKLHAYIHWPNDIVFTIRGEKIKNEDYLRIHGDIKIKTMLSLISSNVGLLYKNKKFYVENIKSKTMKLLPSNEKVYYEHQYTSMNDAAYLSIRYASIDKVEEAFELYYTKHRFYLKSYRPMPSIFLFFDRSGEQILEFSSWSDEGRSDAADGGLLTLIGKVENGKVSVTENETYERLLFNQQKPAMMIPAGEDTQSPPFVQNVFGVRMAKTGFLAEVRRGEAIKHLSAEDISFGADPSKHEIFINDVLEKSMKVEPHPCYSHMDNCLNLRPEYGEFQVCGHVLMKRVHYLDTDKTTVNEECPYIIEFDDCRANFLIEGTLTKQLCSNNNDKMWVEKADVAYGPKNMVTLMY